MKILFQGDSITNAFRRPEEINAAFQLGNGYVFLIASRIAFENPDAPIEFINRGVSGNGVRQLQERWSLDAVELKPDVISVLVGVNETIQAMTEGKRKSPDEFSQTYRDILTELREQNPNIQIIIIEPFLLMVGGVTAEWIQHIQTYQKISEEIAKEFSASFVPLQRVFEAALVKAPASFWAFDGIHPTHAGFELIAREWLRAVEPTLL